MPRRTRRRRDPEEGPGEQLPLGELRRERQPQAPGRGLDLNAGGRSTNNSSNGPSLSEARSGRRDFDDGANALWSLYGKEAQAHDEALFQGLSADMSGIPTFAALFAGVLTSFLVDSLGDLGPDPAIQSVYYQQQSVTVLAQISLQIASIGSNDSIPPAPPQPYLSFEPSSSSIRVNIYWLIGLVCSLGSALFATFVQEWVRSYMQVFQRYDHPLKRARFRHFFFEGARSMRVLASSATLLIRVSLVLFFLGLGENILEISKQITFTIVPFTGGLLIFLFIMLAPLWNLQSPDKSLLSWPIFFLMQKFNRPYFDHRPLNKKLTPVSMEAYQELVVMEETDERKGRDTRALQWLIDRAVATAEMEPLMLAIPGSFNTECGQEVWRELSPLARNTLEPPTGPSTAGGQVTLIPHPPRQLEGAAVDTLSQCMRYMFETCYNRSYFKNEGARHRRMRACVETAASLVCLIDYRLDWFGEVGKVVSEIGQIEKVNSPTTTSDPLFIVRWTCLSLVVIQQLLGRDRLKARFQTEDGQPDEIGWEGAQRIDECLKTAWKRVEDLRRAFEPLTQERTKEQIEEILLTHEQQISDLERIKSEADGMAVVDRQISLYQDAMDDVTHRLIRQLPGVSLDDPRRSVFLLIGDAFDTPATGSTAVTPQLIFPGQQLQALAGLGLQLREVLGGNVEGYGKVLESLKFVDKVPISLRRPNGMMRQLWRLQDVRDGGGFGYTIELFFLSLRRLLSISPLHESNSAFYIGTFKVIASHWMGGRKSPGTHRILLNIICDLIIPGRGIFSNFSCPESITTVLIDVAGKMLQGYTDPDDDICDAVREIEDGDPIQMDRRELQCKALAAFSTIRAASLRSKPEHLEPVVVDFAG